MTPAETRRVTAQIVTPVHTHAVAGVRLGEILRQGIDRLRAAGRPELPS
jgi:hypothetical protein